MTVFLGRCYRRGVPANVLCRATTLTRPTGPSGKDLISSLPATGAPQRPRRPLLPGGGPRKITARPNNVKGGNDGMQSLSVSLQPGQCMAHFLRSDDFGGKFFVDTTETLNKMHVVPAYSVVYLQVSSANVEQAKNGRMLKFKKMKIIPSQKVRRDR